jgi:hypothetical protein
VVFIHSILKTHNIAYIKLSTERCRNISTAWFPLETLNWPLIMGMIDPITDEAKYKATSYTSSLCFTTVLRDGNSAHMKECSLAILTFVENVMSKLSPTKVTMQNLISCQ